MSAAALKPEAVSPVQDDALQFVEPEFKGPVQHVDEFLSRVRVCPIAPGPGGRRNNIDCSILVPVESSSIATPVSV